MVAREATPPNQSASPAPPDLELILHNAGVCNIVLADVTSNVCVHMTIPNCPRSKS